MWKKFWLLQRLTEWFFQCWVWHCYEGERYHAITWRVSQPLLRTSSAPGFHHRGRHGLWYPWVNSLPGEVYDDRRTLLASRYQRWVCLDSFSVMETLMFRLLTHAFSVWIIVQTPRLNPSDNTIQTLVSLSFIPQQIFLADTHASCLLFDV